MLLLSLADIFDSLLETGGPDLQTHHAIESLFDSRLIAIPARLRPDSLQALPDGSWFNRDVLQRVNCAVASQETEELSSGSVGLVARQMKIVRGSTR